MFFIRMWPNGANAPFKNKQNPLSSKLEESSAYFFNARYAIFVHLLPKTGLQANTIPPPPGSDNCSHARKKLPVTLRKWGFISNLKIEKAKEDAARPNSR